MASSEMFLNNYHDGGEGALNGWPHLSVMLGYSLEVTSFVMCCSLTLCCSFSAVSFLLAPFAALLNHIVFFFFLTLNPMLPPCSLLGFGLGWLLGACWGRCRTPFIFLMELCDVWSVLPFSQHSIENSWLSREEERRCCLIPHVPVGEKMKGSILAWEEQADLSRSFMLVCAHINDSPAQAQFWYQKGSYRTASKADFNILHGLLQYSKLYSFMSLETAECKRGVRRVTERKSLNAPPFFFNLQLLWKELEYLIPGDKMQAWF